MCSSDYKSICGMEYEQRFKLYGNSSGPFCTPAISPPLSTAGHMSCAYTYQAGRNVQTLTPTTSDSRLLLEQTLQHTKLFTSQPIKKGSKAKKSAGHSYVIESIYNIESTHDLNLAKLNQGQEMRVHPIGCLQVLQYFHH